MELAARAIEYSSRKGENVLDLFGGSGSTLIAAEELKRRSFLMEIDALYRLVEIAKRMQEGKHVAGDDARWAEEQLADSRPGGRKKLTRGELEMEVRKTDVGRVGS